MDIAVADTTFQFTIMAIIGVITLVVAVAAYLKRNNSKSIVFRTINVIELLSFNDQVKDKLKITYDDVNVQDVTVSLFQFSNTGNITIEPSDFKKPLTLTFKDDIEVLPAELTDRKPENLDITITTHKNIVSVQPEFLNAKDNFTIKVFTNKFFEEEDYHLDYRIIGVNKIKEKASKMDFSSALIIGLMLAGLIMISGVGIDSTDAMIAGLFGFIGIVGYMAISAINWFVEQYNEKRTNKIIFKK
jgi:hypothetical protein